ncbi:MAG: TPM domain-containing protein [Alphaproteobacteria bacterium]|nr:TPM domain-containing protein [Alphaproteobacteria bacterium]
MTRLLSFITALFISAVAIAAPQFPALTGRVVDDAHILSANTVQALDAMLADYERGTTNQVVVVTLSSLQGTSIEDYGYQLGRHWRIGQKDKDNGVLLIVAPTDRKIRIEVGYGLEGELTDAKSSVILHSIILPAFRAGKLEQGIVDGTNAIVSVLGGKGMPAGLESVQQRPVSKLHTLLAVIFLLFFIYFCIRHPVLALLFFSSMRFGGGHGRGGGGFSGGGGSFGGGGSSGSW